MTIEILDLVRDDLIAGYQFYENSQAGIGVYFLSSLYADIEELPRVAGVHRKVYREFHRAISRRFPYAIFYTVEDNILKIRAVVDCRRSPSRIGDHLAKA